MEEVKMFLFTRWVATCYSDILNTESGEWYKKQINHFNNVVYPNYIENGVVEETKKYLKSKSKKATPAEIAAHKAGFHIGDKVKWSGHNPITETIKEFNLDRDGIVCAVLKYSSHNSCNLELLHVIKENTNGKNK